MGAILHTQVITHTVEIHNYEILGQIIPHIITLITHTTYQRGRRGGTYTFYPGGTVDVSSDFIKIVFVSPATFLGV